MFVSRSSCRVFTVSPAIYRGFATTPNLAYTVYQNNGKKNVLYLHGIMGNRRNWGNFINKIKSSQPQWNFITMDLRCHGDSPTLTTDNTMENIAKDVYETLAKNHLSIDAVVGHSFGGKIALEMIKHPSSTLKTAVILDILHLKSMVGRIEDEASIMNIDSIIKAIDDLPLPITSYTYLKEELMKRGLTIELANWLSTSVKRISKNEYQFKFQTQHIRELLKSYRDADYWDVVGNPPPGCHIRIVRAERNVLWTEEIVERLELLSSAIPIQVSTRLVENSGHWVQVDNPDGLQLAISDLFSNCLVCYCFVYEKMIDLSNGEQTVIYIDKLTSLLLQDVMHFIYDISLVDCMMNDDFSKLPPSILNEFSKMSLQDLYNVLKTQQYETSSPTVNQVQQLVNELSLFSHYKYQEIKSDAQIKELPGMKQKKSHEVQQICPLINSIWKESNINTIVDIGAGQGFISYYLANQYHFQVIGVETQNQLVEKINSKYKSTPNFHMITYNITKEMHSSELEDLLNFDSSKLDEFPYGIIGLHCCGDLSASMCRLFVEEKCHAKLLLFVGCCYNLLTTPLTSSVFGYPMNPDRISVPLTKRARNGIVQNTQFDSIDDFESTVQRLFYRCLLQKWIHLYYPEEDDAIQYPVGKLPFEYKKTTFIDYISSFYRQKHPSDPIPSNEEIESFYENNKQYLSLFASVYVTQNLYPFLNIFIVLLVPS